MWIPYALASAVFAAATAILAKIGIEGVPSNVATTVRTFVVLCFSSAWLLARGEHSKLFELSHRHLLFLTLSGIATGLSWLAYFHALQVGPTSRVSAVDKLSLPLTVLLSVLFLKEAVTARVAAGALLMAAGALLTIS